MSYIDERIASEANIFENTEVYRFCCQEDFLLIAIDGLGSMNNAHMMFSCIEEFLRKGVVDICIDYEKCSGIDSTFIGTLLIINEECNKRKGTLHLINLKNELKDKLDNVGFCEIFNVDYSRKIPNVILEPLPDLINDADARMTLVLQAHEKIVESNPSQKEQFGEFIREIKKGFASLPHRKI